MKASPVADQPMLHLFGNGKIEPLADGRNAGPIHAQHQSLKSRLRRPPLVEATIVIGGRCTIMSTFGRRYRSDKERMNQARDFAYSKRAMIGARYDRSG